MKQEEQKSTNENSIKDAYDKLKDCSADDLMQKLSKEIASQKQRGTFDYDGLVKSLDKIKVYLPKETYENMIRIIDSLK